MQQIKLNVKTRDARGRRASGRLRREGLIPGVVYGKTAETRSISVNRSDYVRLFQKAGGGTSLVELSEGGKKGKILSVIQEVQADPVTDEVLHIDFHEVSSKEKMETTVGIHVNGEATGVKNEGGFLDVVLHEITVRCLPKDLPSFIEVDVSGLKMDEAIHVKELSAVPGVEFMADEDQVVVACTAPRVEAAPATEEEGEEKGEEQAEAGKEEGEKKEAKEE